MVIKNKKTRRITAFLVALVMLFGFMPKMNFKAQAAAPTSYTDILAGGSASVSITSSYGAKYFRFTPSQSGSYTFYSDNNSGNSADTYVYLLDSSGNQLSCNDDGGNNLNFSLTYSCTAGSTYYIKAAMFGSNTGSYTLHVSSIQNPTPDPDPVVPDGDYVDIDVAGGTNYPLFNSGRTGSAQSYSSTSNPDDSSYTNNGYDLYANMGDPNEIIQLGLSFVIGVNINEQANVNIYAYDVDEYDTFHGHAGHERDYIFLVNETTGERTQLSGYLSGQNATWNTTSLTVSPDLLEVGNRYHFELDVDCTCGCSTYWVVYVRTVDLIINGNSDPAPTPNTGIENADLSASISSSGLISIVLTANSYAEESYTLEYKAVCTANNAQYGGKEYSVTIPTTSTEFNTTFQLESGAPRGTYEITVFIKEGNTVIATRTVVVSYGYSAVSYNANGGSQNLPTDGTTYSSGDAVTVKFDYIPSRYGYIFLGWSTDSSATEPTYTENGVNTFTIGSSDVVLYAVWQLEVCDHDFVLERVYEATCCQEGENVYVCSICGEFLSEPIPQLEHNFVEGAIVRYPTCTEEGLKEVDKCDLPGCTLAYIQALETIPALGHDYVNGVCSRCGDVRNGKVLLIEDILPWDSNANSIILQDLIDEGIIEGYDKITSLDLANGNVDLLDYALVILAADQNQSFYNNIPIGILENYAQSGGSVFLAADTQGYVDGEYPVFPFGITSTKGTDNNNYIVDYTHPMITGMYSDNNILQNSDMYGGYMSHNYFTNYPVDTNVILRDSSNRATLIEFEYGQGLVVVSGLTFECGYNHNWGFVKGYDDIFIHLYNHNNNGRHTHSYAEVSRTEETCTTDGLVEYACSCGATRVEIIPAHGHNLETTVEREVSCTVDGLIVDHCTNDGCDYERETVVHGEHNYEVTDMQEASCEVEGYIEYTCTLCGDVNVETIEAGMHNYVETSRVEAQVDVEGSITYTCTICNHSYSIVIPALLPVLKNSAVLLIQDTLPWAEDVNTSLLEVLMERGVVSYYNIINTSALASIDLSQYGVVFIANDQTTAMYNRLAQNADKLENYVRAGGNLIYGACDQGWGGCGSLTHELPGGVETSNYYSVHNYIVDELHPVVTGIYTDNRSLRNELLKGNYCSHTYFEVDTLPADANVILRDANGKPTLVEYALGNGRVMASGLTWEYFYVRNHYGMATNYSKYVYDDLVTYMVYMSNTCEHNYELVEAVEPTCEENGYTKYECTLCGHEYMGDIVVAQGHDATQETCTTPAICNVCGEEVRPALGHDMSDATCTDPSTCRRGCGYTEGNALGHDMSDATCTDPSTCRRGCGYTEGNALGHDMSDATCTDPSTCRRGCGYTEGNALGHDMSDATCTDPSTCRRGCGYTEGNALGHDMSDATCTDPSTCRRGCGHTVGSPLGHTESGWIIDVEPTATTPGSRHKECLTCGAILATEEIESLAKITIASTTASVGSVVEIAVSIENNPGVLGAVLTIEYDSHLELMSARSGNAWSMLTLTTPAYYSSPCNFVWDGVNGADATNGDIIILTFRVSESASVGAVYEINASYTHGNIINGNLESIDISIENGSIEVDIIKGDVNSDGTVDVADIVALRRYLAGGYNVSIEWLQADMDEDGMITVADVVLLRRYIVNGQI